MGVETMAKALWEEYFRAMLKQEYKKAVPIMLKLERLEPGNPQVHLKSGDLKVRIGDNAGAIAAYHRAAEGLFAESGQKALAVYKIIARLDKGDRLASDRLAEIARDMERARTPAAPRRGAGAAPGGEAVQGAPGWAEISVSFVPGEAALQDEAFGGGLELGSWDGAHGGEEQGEGEAEAGPELLREAGTAGFPSAEEAASTPEPAMEFDMPGGPGGPGGSEELEAPLQQEAHAQAQAPAQAPAEGPRVPGIFATLSADGLREVYAIGEARAYSNGQEVFREGEPGESLYTIRGGQAIVSTEFRGNNIMIAMLGEGDFFGEMALLTRRPRTATVTAFGELQLVEFGKGALKKIVDRQPGVLKSLTEFYYDRLSESKEILKGTGA